MPRAIEYLYLSDNKIMSLPSDSSTDLHLPALKLLDVSSNEIKYIYFVLSETVISYSYCIFCMMTYHTCFIR